MDRPNLLKPPPEEVLRTVRIGASCESREIGFLKAIIDSYEGLAALRAGEGRIGRVELWVSPDQVDFLKQVLASVADQVSLTMEDDYDQGETSPDC